LLILDAGASSTKEEAARYNRSRYSSLSSKPNCWSSIFLLELARFPYIQAAVIHALVTSSSWIVDCCAAPCMNDTENAEEEL